MANSPVVPVVSEVTSLKTASGATINVFRTETGSTLVGRTKSGSELTVMVPSPATIAMTWGDLWEAAAQGVKALNDLLNSEGGGSGGGGGCSNVNLHIDGNNSGTIVVNNSCKA